MHTDLAGAVDYSLIRYNIVESAKFSNVPAAEQPREGMRRAMTEEYIERFDFLGREILLLWKYFA